MMRHSLWLIAASALALFAAGCGGGMSVGAGGSSGGIGIGAGFNPNLYEQELEDWHSNRIARLTAPDGWLTLVGLVPLSDGTYTFGKADDNAIVLPSGPEHGGTLTVVDTVITMSKGKGVKMTADRERIHGADVVLRTDASPEGPTKVEMSTIQFYVIDRPGTLYLRVKDSASPMRKNFAGIERFPVNKAWRLDAILERHDPPRLMKILNSAGFEETVQSPGTLVFQKDGQTYRLEPVSQEGDELFVVFGDASSGHDTYGGGRFVYVPMPAGSDGKTQIDFNRAYNPPCVFTEFATCPLPTKDNLLPFRVEAGEKSWGDAH